MTETPIDIATATELAEKITALIPVAATPLVISALIVQIVDNMPGSVVEKLTNDPEDFEKAEYILHTYYEEKEELKELIVDSIKILGDEYVLNFLNDLRLDRYAEDNQ